ncbi:GNAT family N-acetyltransferase [Deinococcus aquiradiocola]|uniref:N-acetyltransferase domain-containing protein n=1 Tax=Deinococcus aquiradiocola TaxID=393059 RepID=A0A917PQH1_9DEIO|nr:GNAT family N-acetyltransferase [Deinococcus aquiradiocola]GGJ88314.1 hypothetical protein GCM10008939_35440 [Deinococcus aquiradiocola]
MTELRPMTDATFRRFLNHATTGYAEEKTRSGQWDAASAQARAEGEFLMLCPDGLHTPDHHHFDLHDPTTGQDVGVLWYALRHEGHRTSAFVYEIEIHAPYRRRGYATQAFTLLEQDAAARGATNIQLHVFGHNTGARALYTGLGFHETSIIMRKDLS